MTATVIDINKAPVTKLDFALAYARLGWHVFPCYHIAEDGKWPCPISPDTSDGMMMPGEINDDTHQKNIH